MTPRVIAVSAVWTAASLHACTPADVALGPSSHDTEIDQGSSSSGDSTGTGGALRTPQCERSYDCEPGESCVDGMCSPDACPGGCCPPRCCRDCDVQCKADEHCPLGDSCVFGTCFPPTQVCAETPRFDAQVLVVPETTGCNAVALVQADADSAREIVVATHAGLQLFDSEAGGAGFSTSVAVQLLVADFDGDGDDDLAARDETDRAGEVRMFSQLLGTFVDDGVVALGPGRAASGDLGDDGVHELFVAQPVARGFALHGAIDRAPIDFAVTLDSDAFVVAPIDLQQPGADLVGRMSGATVLMRGGTAAFDSVSQIPDPLDLAPNLGMFATNFSRPDDLDVLSVHNDGPSTFVGTGSGISRSYTVPIVGVVATIGDVDGDGHGDVVVAGPGVLAVLRGVDPECYSVVGIAVDATSLAVGDHDGDGVADVVACDGSTITLLRGRPP